ncbi:MAG: hypothetical protein ABIN11_00210 [candidate division WOR-3 bacterium]
MEKFKELINEGKNIESLTQRSEFFIDLFSKLKYKDYYGSIIVLYNLFDIFEDRFQVIFHLFNHFLYLKLYTEGLNFVKYMEERKNDFFALSLKYRLPDNFSDKSIEELKKNLNLLSQKKDVMSSSYYELAVRSRGLIDSDINDVFFRKAIDCSSDDAKIRVILRYSDILLKEGKEQKSIEILTSYINELDSDFLQLMYKLASIYELQDGRKALEVYEKILKYDPDFLDVQEKISKLTNQIKGYNIKNIEDNVDLQREDRNENHIHFL